MATDHAPDTDALRAARARELYLRLPELYRARDWQRAFETWGEQAVRDGAAVPELEAFLGIVADEIIRMRGHIGDLWDDFFIETCDEWVVPYIAELLGVRLVFNDAQRNRVEVKNTIDWRRRKGSLPMLDDLAGDITGWHAAAAEFFENLGWAQNLNHIKPGHCQAPDLRDPYRISLLGTAQDPWLHSVDVRLPQDRLGWHNIKNIGFFLSRLNAYPQQGVTPAAASAECFWFDPLGRDRPLFDRITRQPVTGPAYAHDPQALFGNADGFAVRQHGILLAAAKPPSAEPGEAQSLWSGFGAVRPGDAAVGLDASAGLELMQPELFETPMRRFKITALWGQDFASATPLGSLASYPPALLVGAKAASPGLLMLRVELDAGSDPAVFPAAMLAVRNDRAERRAADNRTGCYRDALYVYLPEAALSVGEQLDLYVADDGSTYWARRAEPHIGPADVARAAILTPGLDRSLLARAGLGQCFPPRRLAYSLEPSELADLHHVQGLRLADEALFVGRHFLIEARLYADGLGSQVEKSKDYNLVGRLSTFSQDALTAFKYEPGAEISIPAGSRLILQISRLPAHDDAFFPMAELILTERGGQALLLSLPEMAFDEDIRPVWLFFDTEGAAYYASTDAGHDTALARPLRGSALRFDPAEPSSGLARRSAGQVLALPKAQSQAGVCAALPVAYPLRQRLPIYANLCHWDHPKPRPLRRGQLAVDPVLGRFRFAEGETPPAPFDPHYLGPPSGLGVDCHEGFAHDVGALGYDRYPSLKQPENPAPTRYVACTGDASHGSSPVHPSLADALDHAIDGDVIQIEDSATYGHAGDLALPATVKRLVIQAANRQRPCLRFGATSSIRLNGAMGALRLNGLLISGAALRIADGSQAGRVELMACSFDPAADELAVIVESGASAAQISLCRCIGGGLRLDGSVAELVVSDSIIDRPGKLAIGKSPDLPARTLAHLERSTVWGGARVYQLYASECLLLGHFEVGDRQTGCVRYTRYQGGSQLPRRFHCVTDDVAFNSRRFGRPDYAQLRLTCPDSLLGGAENGSEMGAFQGAFAALREKNLGLKLNEYLPVGLTPAVIHTT